MNIAIVGGGPAGLRAAEVAVSSGDTVTLFEGKASVGRKLLVAGKGGLNLTHSEALEKFSSRYSGSFKEGYWTSLLTEFDSTALRDWTARLGINTFVGTSGRVFPKEFKAAPLLRRWVARLRNLGVRFATKHHLYKITSQDDRFFLKFSTPEGTFQDDYDSVILALGGASWPETGSDGKWTSLMQELGAAVIPLTPANCGWEVTWHPAIIAEAEGLPLKNIVVSAGGEWVSGELLITRYGLEGGAVYRLGSTLRVMRSPLLTLDLKPTLSLGDLESKIHYSSGDILSAAASAWRLGKAAALLLKYLSPYEALGSPLALAQFVKSVPIALRGPRPIGEAISSAGGVSFSELDDQLMVKRYPGLFVAGEMLDWEAPTGGYLLQGCFATGTRAGKGAIQYLESVRNVTSRADHGAVK